MIEPFALQSAEADFLDAAARRGLIIGHLIADGKLHRCDAEGKGGRGDGAYLLHLDGIPAGGFQNWRDAAGWQTWRANNATGLSLERRLELKAKADRQRREREAERARAAEEAARRAADFLSRARDPDPAHPYLARKGIAAPGGVRQLGERLIVPVRTPGGELCGAQFISPDGRKTFLTGTPKAGRAFRIPGSTNVVAIGEGLATDTSVHGATGFCAFVAFDAGNLLAVARAVRARMPGARILLAGDDDWLTPGNPGRTKALKAAQAVGGITCFPVFGADRGERETDFNDLHVRFGLDVVRRQIMEALKMS